MSLEDGFKPPKQTGAPHLFLAARYSLCGLQRLWRETAFRHELLLGLGMAVLFAAIRPSASWWLGQIILFILLIAVEALNTAIEVLVDRVSPEFSIPAKDAKDLGSFAVSCLAAANCLWAIASLGGAVLR